MADRQRYPAPDEAPLNGWKTGWRPAWPRPRCRGAAAMPDASPNQQIGNITMASIPTSTDIAAARRARARARAIRAEKACEQENGRPDLLFDAASAHLASGEVELARAQTETLLARADEDPDYAPVWLTLRARDLLAVITRHEDGDPA